MTTPLSTFLDEAEARCKKATLGPWTSMELVEENPFYGWKVVGAGYSILTADTRDGDADQHDCEFAAHARRDLPTALSLLAAFAAVVEEAREYLKGEHEAQALVEIMFGKPEEEHYKPEDLSSWKLLQSVRAADAAVAALGEEKA